LIEEFVYCIYYKTKLTYNQTDVFVLFLAILRDDLIEWLSII